jgi:ferredoxin
MHFTLNHRHLTAQPGETVLQAARAAGVDIPTLCYEDGLEPGVSCYVCVSHIEGQENLQPSCVMPISEGMVITTDSAEVHAARRNALELLLSDHAGRCAAPCVMACPAHWDISGHFREADETTAWRDLVFPATLGQICPGFCQNACVRKKIDEPLSIRESHRVLVAKSLTSGTPALPTPAADTGKRVAIFGSTPAALSAAFHLRLLGHAVTLIGESSPHLCETLWQVPDAQLDKVLLGKEIAALLSLGIAVEPTASAQVFDATLTNNSEHRRTDPSDLTDQSDGVFYFRELVTSPTDVGRNLARSVAVGRRAAAEADAFLRGENLLPPLREFFFASPGCDDLNIAAAEKTPASTDTQAEAARCLSCNCTKEFTCRLRRFSAEYSANPRRFQGERRALAPDATHPEVIYEPGKCILCGLCLKTAQAAGEELGLCFSDRGFDTRVRVPWDGPLSEGLKKSALACAAICPTAALTVK